VVSRRAFLIGGAAGAVGVGAAGLGGAQTSFGRRALHAAGLLDSPDIAVPDPGFDVPVDPGALPSGRRFLLARTSPERPQASIVCLHGRNDDMRVPFDVLGVHRFAAAAGMPLVIASVDGGPASYWHRRRGAPGDPLADLADLAALELPDGPTAVMGWSMGGYGALLAAIERPGEYAAVVASSPAVFRTFDDAAEGAFDDAADFDRHSVLDRLDRLRGARVRVDCGEDDPFAPVSGELLRRVDGAEGRIGPGFHDPPFWRSVLPAQLAFLARVFPITP